MGRGQAVHGVHAQEGGSGGLQVLPRARFTAAGVGGEFHRRVRFVDARAAGRDPRTVRGARAAPRGRPGARGG